MMSEAAMKYIISRVVSNALDALGEAKENKNDEFYEGKLLAYYEVLDTIRNELVVREEKLEEYGITFDVDKTFL